MSCLLFKVDVCICDREGLKSGGTSKYIWGLRYREPHGDDISIELGKNPINKLVGCNEKMENEIVSYLLFKVAACICCKEGSGNGSATLMCLEAEISQAPWM